MFKLFKKSTKAKKSHVWDELLKTRYLPEADFFYGEVAKFDQAFVDNELKMTKDPGMSVNTFFKQAMELHFAGFDPKVVQADLNMAQTLADTILAMPAEQTEHWNGGEKFYDHSYNPSIRMDKTYIDGWLNSTDIDNDYLAAATNYLLDNHYLFVDKYFWDEMAKDKYLVCLIDLWIAGKFEAASQRLKIERSFKNVERFYDWSKKINELLISQQSGEGVTGELAETIDIYFNEMRYPQWMKEKKDSDPYSVYYSSDKLAFKLAILRWLYVEKQPLAGNWQQVLAQVTK